MITSSIATKQPNCQSICVSSFKFQLSGDEMAETSQKATQRSQTVLKGVKNKSKCPSKLKRLKRSTNEKAKKTPNGERIELVGTAQSINQSSQEMVEGSEAKSQSPHKKSRLPNKDENSSSASQPLKNQHSSENEAQCSHETVKKDSRDKEHGPHKQGRLSDKGERPPLRYSYIKSSDNAYQSLMKKKELLDKCQTSFRRNIKLNWKSPHTRVETYHFCGICKSIFNDKRSFEEHAKTAHISTQNEELKNQKPGNSTGSEGSENQQTRDTFEISQDEKFLEAGQGPLVLLCAVCNSVFTTIRLLKEHTEKIHGGAKFCQDTNLHLIKDVEDTSFPTGSKKKCESIQGVLKQSGRSSDEDVVPPCLDKETAKQLLTSKGHAKVMQNKELILEEIRRDGRVMGYTYSYKPKPEKRAEKYKGILSGNTCLICQKEFKKRKNACGHAQLIHFAVKKFFCTYCNKGFKRSHHLRNHLTTHTGAKPYSCFYCEASFGKKDKLKLHLRMHTGERPYRCEVCSKTFRKWEHLNQHLLVHQKKVSDQDGVRYKCKICSEENSTVNEFLEHVNIHKDGNSAFCNFCDESFRSMYELRQHKCKNAVPSVVYLCPICKVVFRTKNLVEEHAKKQHSQNEKNGRSALSNSGIMKSKSSRKAKRSRANKNKGQSDSVNEMYSDGTDEGNQGTLSYLENVIASDVLQHISNMHLLADVAAEQQAQHLSTQFLQCSSWKGQNYGNEAHQENTGERDCAETTYNDNSSENNDNFDLEDFNHDTYHGDEGQQSSSSQMKRKKQFGSDSAVNSTNTKTVKQSSAHKRQMAGNPNVFNESTIEDQSMDSSKTRVLLGADEGQGTCDREMSSEVEQSQGSSSSWKGQNYGNGAHQENTGERDCAEATYDDSSFENNDNFDLEDFNHDTYHGGEGQESSSSQMKRKKQGGSDSAVNSKIAKTVRESSAHKWQMAGNPNVFNESTIEDQSMDSSKRHVLLGADKGQGTCDKEMSSEVEQSQGSSSSWKGQNYGNGAHQENTGERDCAEATYDDNSSENNDNFDLEDFNHDTYHGGEGQQSSSSQMKRKKQGGSDSAVNSKNAKTVKQSSPHKWQMAGNPNVFNESTIEDQSMDSSKTRVLSGADEGQETCDKEMSSEVEQSQGSSSFSESCDDLNVSDDEIQGKTPSECVADSNVCTICLSHFTSHETALVHVKLNHFATSKSHKCRLCEKQFSNRKSVLAHVKYVHIGEKNYVCEHCHKGFKQQHKLTLHVRSHTGEKPHVCIICSASFARKDKLQCHLRRHTGERPHRCDICGKCFVTWSNLRQHLDVHSAIKDYKCVACSLSFTSRDALYNHQKTHKESGKEYMCHHCDKGFSSRTAFVHHMKLHSNSGAHYCDVCGKVFVHEGSLINHKLTHLSEQNFECKVCSAVFTEEDGLREHQLTHKDGKSAICSFCNETFDNVKEYGKHKCQQAIPSTAFLCSQCKSIFRTEDLIKQHFANIHKKEYVGVATVKISI